MDHHYWFERCPYGMFDYETKHLSISILILFIDLCVKCFDSRRRHSYLLNYIYNRIWWFHIEHKPFFVIFEKKSDMDKKFNDQYVNLFLYFYILYILFLSLSLQGRIWGGDMFGWTDLRGRNQEKGNLKQWSKCLVKLKNLQAKCWCENYDIYILKVTDFFQKPLFNQLQLGSSSYSIN